MLDCLEEGCKEVCEAVKKYGDECERRGFEKGFEKGFKKGLKKAEKKGAMEANRKIVEKLMNKMALSLDQALNVLDIQGEERSMIAKQILR